MRFDNYHKLQITPKIGRNCNSYPKNGVVLKILHGRSVLVPVGLSESCQKSRIRYSLPIAVTSGTQLASFP